MGTITRPSRDELLSMYVEIRQELLDAYHRYSLKTNINMESIRDNHVGHLEITKKWLDQNNATMFLRWLATIRRSIKNVDRMVESGYFNLDAKK